MHIYEFRTISWNEFFYQLGRLRGRCKELTMSRSIPIYVKEEDIE